MKFTKFSPKQKLLLNWWANKSYSQFEGIICDGAVRSGKTMCMTISFLFWSMSSFNGRNFGLCGKTIRSLQRNVVTDLMSFAKQLDMSCTLYPSKNYLECSIAGVTNRYYFFGGKDEGSSALIQGITLAGILLDETALMPRSFVEQAVARCSVTGSKLWFNCNPENPYHWFKTQWIDKSTEKNLLHLSFTMEDNPSLSEEILKRYHRLYSGAFYDRFVLGKWTAAQGICYPMFSEKNTFTDAPHCTRYAVSCDYGTVNPASFGLWGESNGKWYRLKEYYYDSREKGARRTDEEHYVGLEKLIGDKQVERVICDPSASSFIECIRRHGKYNVVPAKNDVVSGIRRVADALTEKRIYISANCVDTIREFSLYRWDEKGGQDCPIKEHDHAMDDIRYFVTAYLQKQESFFVLSVDR